VKGFLTPFIATRAGILTSASSTPLHSEASAYSGTLLYHQHPVARVLIRGFGDRLESRSFSAQEHLTGEQLRTP
jgi:hypothetical protein